MAALQFPETSFTKVGLYKQWSKLYIMSIRLCVLWTAIYTVTADIEENVTDNDNKTYCDVITLSKQVIAANCAKYIRAKDTQVSLMIFSSEFKLVFVLFSFILESTDR